MTKKCDSCVVEQLLFLSSEVSSSPEVRVFGCRESFSSHLHCWQDFMVVWTFVLLLTNRQTNKQTNKQTVVVLVAVVVVVVGVVVVVVVIDVVVAV